MNDSMECSIVKSTLLTSQNRPSAISWAANGNLIAIAFPPEPDSTTAAVWILEPDALQECEVLYVPLLTTEDVVAFISFSPTDGPLMLMTTTRQGNIFVWTPRTIETLTPIASNTWCSEKIELDCEEVVLSKFLSQASRYRWPPHDQHKRTTTTTCGISVETRFLVTDHISSGDPPWLRDGILHIVTLDAAKMFRITCRSLDGWMSTRGESLSPYVDGALCLADVIASVGSRLRMVVVSDAHPETAFLIDIRGVPRVGPREVRSFTFEVLCSIQASLSRPLMDARFQPEGLGNCLIVLQSSENCVAISKHTVSAHDRSTFAESNRCVLSTERIETSIDDGVCMELSPDGECIALCISGSDPILITMSTLSVSDRLTSKTSSTSFLGTFSPNGVVFASLSEKNTHFKLEMWTLPESSLGMSKIFEKPRQLCAMDSMRLTWSMLTEADHWDICQRIHHNIDSVPSSMKYYALFCLDRMLDRHPLFHRDRYSDLLDKIKIRILLNTNDPTEKAVLIDLYARRIVSHFFHGYMTTFNAGHQNNAMEVDASHWCERDKESCRKWIQWNENFFLFLCQSIQTWVSKNNAPNSCDYNAVPFVRLLCDDAFVRNLSCLFTSFVTVSKHLYPRAQASEKAQQFRSFALTLKNIKDTIRESSDRMPDLRSTEASEAIEAFRSMAHDTRKTFGGSVSLHYARLYGTLIPEALIAIGKLEKIREALPLSPVEIESKAVQLGLLPDKALKGFIHFRRKQKQMSFPSPKKIGVKLPIFDCIRGRPLIEDRYLYHAVDQSCASCFTLDENDQDRELSQLDITLLKQSAARSPFTGSLWKRLHKT